MNIKQTVKRILTSTVILAGILFVIAPLPASALTCGGVQTSLIQCDEKGATCPDGTSANETDTCCPKGGTATAAKEGEVCDGGTKPTVAVEDTGVWGILLIAINILTAGVGVVAVAGIVYASIMYTSAGGNAEQVKKAMTIIADIVIGVVAYALMYAVLNFITPGGLFN